MGTEQKCQSRFALKSLGLLGAFIVGLAAVAGVGLEYIKWLSPTTQETLTTSEAPPMPPILTANETQEAGEKPIPVPSIRAETTFPSNAHRSAPARSPKAEAPPEATPDPASQHADNVSINVSGSPGAITGANVNLNNIHMEPQP